ncbi:MAG: hypothetical protein CMJ83_19625 [Planctomycetes bacterium]|nr:hypothetical protein [Planctomycetota bacterium]
MKRRGGFLGLAMLMLVGGAWWWLQASDVGGEDPVAQRRSGKTVAQTPDVARSPTSEGPAVVTAPYSETMPAPPDTRERPEEWIIQTVWNPGGEPAPGIGVRFGPPSSRGDWPIDPSDFAHGVTDQDGLLRLPRGGREIARVQVDRDGDFATLDASSVGTIVKLQVTKGAEVTVLAKDSDGLPVADARVWFSNVTTNDEGDFIGRTDRAGRFTIRHAGPHATVNVFSDAHRPPRTQRLVDHPDSQTLVFVLHHGGAPLRGQVLTAAGRPAAGAGVFLWPDVRHARHQGKANDPYRPFLRTRADLDGRFAFPVTLAAPHTLRIHAAGHGPHAQLIDLSGEEHGELEIQLASAARLSGIVTSSGVPVPKATISIRSVAFRFEEWEASTDPDGHFTATGLPAGRVDVTVAGSAVKPAVSVVLEPGVETSVELKIDEGIVLAGRLVDAHDAPLSGWRILVASNTRRRRSFGTTGRDGSFRIPDCTEGPCRVLVLDGADGLLSCTRESVYPLRGPLLIKLTQGHLTRSRVTGRALGVSGQPAQGTIRIRNKAGGSQRSCDIDGATGDFDSGLVPPGDYEILHSVRPLPNAVIANLTLQWGEVRKLGTFRAQEPGAFELRLRFPEGVAGDTPCSVSVLAGPGRLLLGVEDGIVAMSKVPPGTYRLRLHARGCAPRELSFEVRSAQTTKKVVRLERDA